jgi:hypothetical protein
MPTAKLSDAQPIPQTGRAKLSDVQQVPSQVQPEPGMGAQFMQGAENLGKGMLKGAGSTANSIGSMLIPDRLVRALGGTPPTQPPPMLQTHGTAQGIGKGIEQAGEFLLPGLGEEGAGAKLAELAPRLGKMAAPIARAGVQTLGSAAVNKAQGGSATTGALMGAGGAAVGEGMRAAAPLLAESALGVKGADKMYGRTVGNAIMEDTQGVRPSTIEESARGKIGELKPQLEQAASNAGASGARGSLLPARQGVDTAIQNNLTNRAAKTAGELEPLQSHLATDAVTGLPLAQDQTPTGLLQLKRGLNSDFIRNWSPLTGSRPALGQARSAYGSLADALHTAAPETEGLDQRISSLIPVANRAETTARAPGVLENTMNRFRAPTGALTGMFMGGAAGGASGGIPGAIAGAGAGALLPSVISSPTTQMILARGLYNGVPKLVPAATGTALQLDRENQ